MVKTLFLACLVSVSPLNARAQVRTRQILTWRGDDYTLVVEASSEGTIDVGAKQGADIVWAHVYPKDVDAWADSAVKIVDANLRAPGGDKVTFETGTLFGKYAARIALRREVSSTEPRELLYFSDEYEVNTVYVPVTAKRAHEFIDALRKAAAAVTEISH